MISLFKKRIQRVRAIIINDSKILLINRVKAIKSYWIFPGGRVESGESKEEAIKRECIEELGIKIRVKELFAKKISSNLKTKGHYEFFYLCDAIGGKLGAGNGPEYQANQINYEGEYNIQWVNLNKLADLNLKPEKVKNKIIDKLIKFN